MAKDKKEPVTVIAELEVTWPGGRETIKTFDKAWHRALELLVPVTVSFKRFARID
jgi:hypothetical protein